MAESRPASLLTFGAAADGKIWMKLPAADLLVEEEVLRARSQRLAVRAAAVFDGQRDGRRLCLLRCRYLRRSKRGCCLGGVSPFLGCGALALAFATFAASTAAATCTAATATATATATAATARWGASLLVDELV